MVFFYEGQHPLATDSELPGVYTVSQIRVDAGVATAEDDAPLCSGSGPKSPSSFHRVIRGRRTHELRPLFLAS